MKDRIQKIIDSDKLTASKFAEMIGVQKSSVSHIISGRNKPSLDFVQKVLSAFPAINSDWLLFGAGNMYKADSKPTENQTTAPLASPIVNQPILEKETEDITSVSENGKTVAKASTPNMVAEQVFSQPNTQAQAPESQTNKAFQNNGVNNSGYQANNQGYNQAAQNGYERAGNVNQQPQGQSVSATQVVNNQQIDQQTQQFVNNQAAMMGQQKPQPIDILGSNPDRIIVFYSDKTFDWFSPMGK